MNALSVGLMPLDALEGGGGQFDGRDPPRRSGVRRDFADRHSPSSSASEDSCGLHRGSQGLGERSEDRLQSLERRNDPVDVGGGNAEAARRGDGVPVFHVDLNDSGSARSWRAVQ